MYLFFYKLNKHVELTSTWTNGHVRQFSPISGCRRWIEIILQCILLNLNDKMQPYYIWYMYTRKILFVQKVRLISKCGRKYWATRTSWAPMTPLVSTKYTISRFQFQTSKYVHGNAVCVPYKVIIIFIASSTNNSYFSFLFAASNIFCQYELPSNFHNDQISWDTMSGWLFATKKTRWCTDW